MDNVTSSSAFNVPEDISINVREDDGSNRTRKFKVHPYQVVARVFGEMTYNSRNSGVVEGWMVDVLRTVCAINALPEYATGLRVGDVHYHFGEYELPDSLCRLVVPAKVVLVDVPSAKDFYDRNQFNVSFGKVLTPDEVSQNLRSVATKSRLDWSYTPVIRKKVGLLTDEIGSAVFAGKVVSEKLNHIIYLNQKFDEEAQVDVDRWARRFASDLN